MGMYPLPTIASNIDYPLQNQRGVTYLFMMILMVTMSVGLLAVTQQWSVIMQRDREAELHFRGTRIKEAIDRFVADYEVQKATRSNQWPRSLKELTKKNPKRYLQQVYLDPLTGKDFALIKVGDEIHGVQSTSTKQPYNKVLFQGAQTYRAIRFEATGVATDCKPNALNPLLAAKCTSGGSTENKEGTTQADQQVPSAPPTSP